MFPQSWLTSYCPHIPAGWVWQQRGGLNNFTHKCKMPHLLLPAGVVILIFYGSFKNPKGKEVKCIFIWSTYEGVQRVKILQLTWLRADILGNTGANDSSVTWWWGKIEDDWTSVAIPSFFQSTFALWWLAIMLLLQKSMFFLNIMQLWCNYVSCATLNLKFCT